MLLGSFGASPWYIQWNKVSTLMFLLCASGSMAFLLREASDIAIILTARLWVAPSWTNDVLEAAVHTNETYSILDLTMLL